MVKLVGKKVLPDLCANSEKTFHGGNVDAKYWPMER